MAASTVASETRAWIDTQSSEELALARDWKAANR